MEKFLALALVSPLFIYLIWWLVDMNRNTTTEKIKRPPYIAIGGTKKILPLIPQGKKRVALYKNSVIVNPLSLMIEKIKRPFHLSKNTLWILKAEKPVMGHNRDEE